MCFLYKVYMPMSLQSKKSALPQPFIPFFARCCRAADARLAVPDDVISRNSNNLRRAAGPAARHRNMETSFLALHRFLKMGIGPAFDSEIIPYGKDSSTNDCQERFYYQFPLPGVRIDQL